MTPADTTATTAAETAAGEETVTVYRLDEQDALVSQTVTVAHGSALVAAVTALAEPSADTGVPVLPEGTRVRSVRAEGSVATVDLSADFVDGYPAGGSAAEAAILGPLVYTVTEFDGIDGMVLVVDGAPPDLLGSAYDFSAPLTRADVPVAIAASP